MYNVMLLAGLSLSIGLQSLALADAEFPSAEMSNGVIKLNLYLPDPEKGYYRGTRFDWSGVISQVEYQGHTYFDEWKDTHDPGVHDDIIGPVEEFRTDGSALGYEEAKPGESFVKIGIGLLEKADRPEYSFSYPYRIIKPGTWKVSRGENWIEFQQDFAEEGGWGYFYIKRISLAKDKPRFVIRHSLKNTGSKTIETSQYNHNFFAIDRQPIGKSYVLRFPFKVKAARDLRGIMETRGNQLVFIEDLKSGSLFTEIEGFRNDAEDHRITILNTKTGAGVRIKGDKPLSEFNFWTMPRTVCPEPYIKFSIAPGETEEWKTNYTFFVRQGGAE
jgi:hypothetical protein